MGWAKKLMSSSRIGAKPDWNTSKVCQSLWRVHDDGRKLYAGTIEAADPRELVIKWSAFLATSERGVYFATYRGSFVAPGVGARERPRRPCRLD